jgi:hypothetical protein
MLEFAMFTGLLSSVGGLIKVANESKNFELTNSLIELQQRIIALQGACGELQQNVFDAQKEARELADKLRAADEKLAVRAMPFHDGAQWLPKEGGEEDGPFCPSCWSDGLIVRPEVYTVDNGYVNLMCKRHTNNFYFSVQEKLVKGMYLDGYRVSHEPRAFSE